MRLSSKLLGFLNRAFSKDPEAFLGLRLSYDGGMQWTVADGFLSTVVQGGSGRPLLVDLSAYTVGSLGGFLSLQPGYSVLYRPADFGQLGAAALRLLDGTGDIFTTNGDHLLAYNSILYAWVDTYAVELAAAESSIAGMPAELSTTTADGTWLDYQGSYYRVLRLAGEPDAAYSGRIIAEVMRPLGNNVAIEDAISTYTGQDVTVSDVVFFRAPEPNFSGFPHFNGVYTFQPTLQPVYGLFDVNLGYDLLSGAVPAQFVVAMRAIIARMRDAGTQLRAIALKGSVLRDPASVPHERDDAMTVTHLVRFDGNRHFNGLVGFTGDTLEYGTIEATASIAVIPGGGPFLLDRSHLDSRDRLSARVNTFYLDVSLLDGSDLMF